MDKIKKALAIVIILVIPGAIPLTLFYLWVKRKKNGAA